MYPHDDVRETSYLALNEILNLIIQNHIVQSDIIFGTRYEVCRRCATLSSERQWLWKSKCSGTRLTGRAEKLVANASLAAAHQCSTLLLASAPILYQPLYLCLPLHAATALDTATLLIEKGTCSLKELDERSRLGSISASCQSPIAKSFS